MCRTFFPFTDMIPERMHSCTEREQKDARRGYLPLRLLPFALPTRSHGLLRAQV